MNDPPGPTRRAGPLRVLVVTGDHSLPDPTKWHGGYTGDDLSLHAEMCAALESLGGYAPEFLTSHDALFDRLGGRRPDLVLNFCDTGLRNVATQELHVPALLEAFGIPYTGAPPACMVLCYDKSIVRHCALSLGVPVPRETVVPPDLPLERVEASYPALIKPAEGDGSVGITRDALVTSPAAARRQLEWFRGALPGRTALVQEYLPGTEYGMALLGNPGAGFRAFPPLQVDYTELPAGLPPILAFESKTGPETPYSKVRIERARLSPEVADTMRQSAERLFARLGCRDYARFDFRTGTDGTIKLLEVNPNPAWSSAGKLAIMAGFGGTDYPALLGAILEAARARIGV